MKRLDEIAAHVSNFRALVNIRQQCQHQEAPSIKKKKRETGLLLTDNKVFGRDRERDTLVQWLMKSVEDDKSYHVSLYSIVGHGGMGKTTLAQLVCNDKSTEVL